MQQLFCSVHHSLQYYTNCIGKQDCPQSNRENIVGYENPGLIDGANDVSKEQRMEELHVHTMITQ